VSIVKNEPTSKLLTEVEISVPEAVVDVLIEAGIDTVFGMPGGLMMHLYDALHDHPSEIRAVLVRQESIGTIMADVYGRLTGRPGVATGQGAWMLGSASTGTLEGFLSGSPMLILTEMTDGSPYSHHAPYQSGTGEWGSWDARTSFSGITKRTMVVTDGPQAVHAAQIAIKHAMSGQPGPVAILFHSRALASRVGPDAAPRLYATGAYLPTKQGAGPEAISEAARLIAGARTVAIAGNGVWLSHAFGQLQAFAEATGIPVATTAKGKSALPETHPLALGVMGPFGTAVANDVIADAEVILAIGTKLGASDTANENPDLIDPTHQRIVQIDVEPLHASWTYPAHQVVGDAGLVLDQLRFALEAEPAAKGPELVKQKREQLGFFDDPALTSESTPILPQRAIAELQKAVTAETIVTCDAGENRIFMTHFFQSKSAGSFIQPAGVGGMGYAVPAALGAKVVRPDSPVVAVCGDGGFGMSFAALMTSIEERIPIVVVVFNNSSLGWVKHEQRDRVIAADLTPFDHAAIARAMGCNGVRVEDPAELGGVLESAIADASKTTVVDVITSPGETFLTVQSPLAS
jgi:acetolactate synthase I/II/III large subunit